jgi:hypothetical protein
MSFMDGPLAEVDLLKSFFDPMGGNGNNRVGNYLIVLGFTHVKTVLFYLAVYYVTRSHALDAMTLHPLSVLCRVRRTVIEFKAASGTPSIFPSFII